MLEEYYEEDNSYLTEIEFGKPNKKRLKRQRKNYEEIEREDIEDGE